MAQQGLGSDHFPRGFGGAKTPDTRRRIALLTPGHPNPHRDRFFVASAAKKIQHSARRPQACPQHKHAHNTRNMAVGLSAQSRIGTVRYTGQAVIFGGEALVRQAAIRVA
jgi:hypothetical protein